jgi:hypothetical protein
MSQSSSHITSIVVTPKTLKEQIIIRMNTIINKAGGDYYTYDDQNNPTPIVTIEDVDVYGLETKGKDVYLMSVVNTDEWNNDGTFEPYNANEFFLEQLWEVYVAMAPLYESKFNDYANFQQD